ncbi:unnamed protein product [Closterium sp. Naga37s-1]|nr:unnamed protein product [Closterium sp. Naga37s-1]
MQCLRVIIKFPSFSSAPLHCQIARMDSLFEAHFSPLTYSGKPMGRCGKSPLKPSALVQTHHNPLCAAPVLPLPCQIARMDSLFEAHFSPLAASGKPMGRCGKCGRFMPFVPLKPTRLLCPTCEDIFNLPQNGAIKLYKELTCPLDNYELVIYSLPGPEGKTFPLCPYCYNHPPFEDLGKPITPAASTTSSSSKPAAESPSEPTSQASSRTGSSVFTGMACTSCGHVSCRHSLVSMGVCPCPECEGTLVLDPVSTPKWRLDCNRCSCVVFIKANVHRMAVVPMFAFGASGSLLKAQQQGKQGQEGEKEGGWCSECGLPG